MNASVGTCIDSCAALFLLLKQALRLCPSLCCPNQLLSWGFMREWGYLSSPSIDGIYILTSLPPIYTACLRWGVKERQQIQWSLNHSPYMNVIDWKYYYYYTIYLSNEWVTRGEKYLMVTLAIAMQIRWVVLHYHLNVVEMKRYVKYPSNTTTKPKKSQE